MQTVFEDGEGSLESFAASCLLLRDQLARVTDNEGRAFDSFFQLLCDVSPLPGELTDEEETVKVVLHDTREIRGNLVAVDAKGNLLLQNCRMRTCVRYRDENGRHDEDWRECLIPVPLVCPASRVKAFKARLDCLLSISATMQSNMVNEDK
ncbi:conserved hypothetical protein [Neospora caninum Liverpool]|uniref:Sm domain-containing protein n=1 Tax=Neospora caninum (strain Liverpool) TaxID=572307 RepID=F0VKF8_NEOCL|nr:conserved hypothetical protein [Neospora caninum Liverpool]CBZ54559.1 conserved hypothetical protein [Neospora caninum Liverpool]CEL69273.1 TPA: hypothetical protein BN1204_049880 [Neospora caninum Liverpool]|eukprot:XP_003884589.1 conserved hypothetical protein [Neospora caninum Liverpool]